MMYKASLLFPIITGVLAAPQSQPQPSALPESGDNGQMGGIFGPTALPNGIPIPQINLPPGLLDGIGSALSSFVNSIGGANNTFLMGLLGSVDIAAIIPTGKEYPKEKLTIEQVYDAGSGPYPAHFLTDPALGNHTIYAPKQPPPANVKLPVFLWGNGGCTAGGTPYATYLTEIASHGYIAIANGPPGAGPPSLIGGSLNLTGPNGEKAGNWGGVMSGMSLIKDMLNAIDWVEKGNADRFGNIDKDTFITGGSSCGGLESYSTSYHNPKVKLTTLFNSGLIGRDKAYLLKELKAPVAFFTGGPLDPGYQNSKDDYDALPEGLPVLKADLDSGHLGTFFAYRGGKYAKATLALFDWALHGDQKGKAVWTDPKSSGSLVSENWNVTYKNVDKFPILTS